MKYLKTMPDLLQDLFDFFQKKYGDGEPYEGRREGSPGNCKIMPFRILDCPQSVTPGMFLKSYGTNKDLLELVLTAHVPWPDYNRNFYGELLTVHASVNGTNALWIAPNDSIGGISNIMSFNSLGSKVLSALRLEVIIKTHELFFSGEYNVDRFKLSEKVSI